MSSLVATFVRLWQKSQEDVAKSPPMWCGFRQLLNCPQGFSGVKVMLKDEWNRCRPRKLTARMSSSGSHRILLLGFMVPQDACCALLPLPTRGCQRLYRLCSYCLWKLEAHESFDALLASYCQRLCKASRHWRGSSTVAHCLTSALHQALLAGSSSKVPGLSLACKQAPLCPEFGQSRPLHAADRICKGMQHSMPPR